MTNLGSATFVAEPGAIDGGGSTMCAIASDGNVYCWGGNGELLGSPQAVVDEPTPIANPTGQRLVQVSVGQHHACAVSDSGDAYCWGDHTYGQLGSFGATEDVAELQAVATQSLDPGEVFVEVACGDRHTCASTSQNRVFCWGDNSNDQLAVPDVASTTSVPRVIDSPVWGRTATLTQLDASMKASCAVVDATPVSTHTIYCWGRNTSGKLGALDPGHVLTEPLEVEPAANAANVEFRRVSTNFNHTCAVADDGQIYCWGRKEHKLGTVFPSISGSDIPHPDRPIDGGRQYLDVAVGTNHSCGVSVANEVFCWGHNENYRLGVSGPDTPTPQQVVFPSR
ncbi:hypothetical protein FIV42_20075 [Persicimonas caeni]|uniref:Chromosome condensation regulator RCC1 n=2 Tax=Persicimonas caeni TaxID=2292766 RepID=A0A4Y6PY76_PERCE|nr:hypothetical protein FIV42_20075 [Persicimonas caeni]QED34179.1 hypothetical protein FRD00_20070 [Persicimonas caeni]